jgi:hypothetical protein
MSLRRLAAGLSLAAAPTFAAMALLTQVFGQGPMAQLCSGAAFPLGGMVPMYLLMSGFHLGPWLKLLSDVGSAAAGSSLKG